MMYILALALSLLSVRGTLNCFEPCNAKFIVSIEPAADNDYVSFELQSDAGYYRYSEWPLSAKSPKTMQVGYERLPGGNYSLRTIVYKHDAKTWIAASTATPLNVIAR